MASQTQGIQQLLAAEKRAAEKVSEARKRNKIFSNSNDMMTKLILIHFPIIGKQKRLKQAKEEAQEEIERYRQERERQFKEFEAKVSFSCVVSWFLILCIFYQLDSVSWIRISNQKSI